MKQRPVRNTLLAILLTVGAMGAALAPQSSIAAVSVGVQLTVPPPPLRYEQMPELRRGYVWVPGYWDWRGHHHVWVSGVWVKERHGYHYQPHTWVARNGGWTLERGRWDRDHDGVPDRYDRHPANPYRP